MQIKQRGQQQAELWKRKQIYVISFHIIKKLLLFIVFRCLCLCCAVYIIGQLAFEPEL